MLRKQRNRSAGLSHPRADFALRFEMITKDEHQQILRGNMELTGNTLLNVNADLPYLKTGTAVAIYRYRGLDVLADMITRN